MSRYGESLFANRLLAALPSADLEALLPELRSTELHLRQVVCECGEKPKFAYFPTTSVVSLLYTTETGASADTALVGNDGMLGIAILLGGDTMPADAVVQIPGHALYIPAAQLQDEFAVRPQLPNVLLRYTQALLTQISQTAICNRLHSMEKRLSRRLLICQDRVQSEELSMTQDFMSQMLGGRRESVTVAAGHLQDAGLIRYSRGRIRILNRRGLEENACECYRTVKSEYERLLGPAALLSIPLQPQRFARYANSA